MKDSNRENNEIRRKFNQSLVTSCLTFIAVVSDVGGFIEFTTKKVPEAYGATREYIHSNDSKIQTIKTQLEQIQTYLINSSISETPEVEEQKTADLMNLGSESLFVGSEIIKKAEQDKSQVMLETNNKLLWNQEELELVEEVDKRVENLKTEITKFDQIIKGLQYSREAAEWLTEETRLSLAKQALGSVITKDSGLKHKIISVDSEAGENFCKFLLGYLYLIYCCLNMYSTSTLDKALKRNLFSGSLFPASDYVKTLKEIKSMDRVPNILSRGGNTKLEFYIEYLINSLS